MFAEIADGKERWRSWFQAAVIKRCMRFSMVVLAVLAVPIVPDPFIILLVIHTYVKIWVSHADAETENCISRLLSPYDAFC
jgi:hypothetical protein